MEGENKSLLLFFAESAPVPERDPATGLPLPQNAILCRLTSDNSYRCMTGREAGLFCLRISLCSGRWGFDLMDFVGFYESAPFPALVFASDEHLEQAREVYQGRHFAERRLRFFEPRVLVHSTGPEGWRDIRADGALCSWAALKARAAVAEKAPIGGQLGDPAEFSNYIMFSDPGQIAGELVVSSRQSGFINMDAGAPYRPGARLYLDAAMIARDGLLLRDGAHLKVRDRLPLAPYLLYAATPQALGLHETSTPAAFAALADKAFFNACPAYREART